MRSIPAGEFVCEAMDFAIDDSGSPSHIVPSHIYEGCDGGHLKQIICIAIFYSLFGLRASLQAAPMAESSVSLPSETWVSQQPVRASDDQEIEIVGIPASETSVIGRLPRHALRVPKVIGVPSGRMPVILPPTAPIAPLLPYAGPPGGPWFYPLLPYPIDAGLWIAPPFTASSIPFAPASQIACIPAVMNMCKGMTSERELEACQEAVWAFSAPGHGASSDSLVQQMAQQLKTNALAVCQGSDVPFVAETCVRGVCSPIVQQIPEIGLAAPVVLFVKFMFEIQKSMLEETRMPRFRLRFSRRP